MALTRLNKIEILSVIASTRLKNEHFGSYNLDPSDFILYNLTEPIQY